MIGKVTRGQRVVGLLHYLYGPGRANEHADPHLAAAWDAPAQLEPALRSGRHDLKRLGDLLQQPLHISPHLPDRPVWHCALRTAPGDPTLSDADWDRVAREVLHRTGLAPRGDSGACRWVAVRHADDHVHLVVTLARQDGARVTVFRDYFQVGAACRAEEERLGLRLAAAPDRTAAPRPTRAEAEKAQREGRRQAPRVILRRDVQQAAARADSPDSFLAELRRLGVLVRERRSEQDPHQITGYAVALPGDKTSDGSPVWFAGSKLAPELSWGRLRQRWDAAVPEVGDLLTTADPTPRGIRTPGPGQVAAVESGRSSAPAVLSEARDTIAAATAHLAGDAQPRQPHSAEALRTSGVALAGCDVLAVTARLVEGRIGGDLTDATELAWRAARIPHARAAPPSPLSLALRHHARLVARLPRLSGQDAEAWGTVRDLLHATARFVEAIGQLRAAQQVPAQGGAARSSSAAIRRVLAEQADWPRTGTTTRRRLPMLSTAVGGTVSGPLPLAASQTLAPPLKEKPWTPPPRVRRS